MPLDSNQLISIANRLPKTGPLIQPILLRAFESSANPEVGLAVIQMAQNKQTTVEIGEVRRTLSKYPESVRKRIPEAEVDQDRQARLASLSHLLKNGDAVAGEKVFRTGRIACTTCHSIGGKGGMVGPDLTKLGPFATVATCWKPSSTPAPASREAIGLILS